MLLQFIAAALTSEPLGAPGVVSISDATSNGFAGDDAGVIFHSNGNFSRYIHFVPIVTSTWLTPQTNMSQYEIRFTAISGTPSTGTLDTWLPLSSNQQVLLSISQPNVEDSCTILAEIRWTGNNEVQDSATYTLNATGPAD